MDTFNLSQMPPVQTPVQKKSSAGPLIAVIIILALIVIGGLYFLKERSSQEVYAPAPRQEGDTITQSLNQQGSGDELGSIEADLDATGIDNLDQGAAAIEAELR